MKNNKTHLERNHLSMGVIFAVVFLVLMFVIITQRQPFPTGRAGEAPLDDGGRGPGKSSSSAISENFASKAMQGYIVQLDSPPLVTGIIDREKIHAQRIPGAAVPRRAGTAPSPPKSLSELRSELEREHNDVKGGVKELLDNALRPNILATGNAVNIHNDNEVAGNAVDNQNGRNGNSAASQDYFYTFNGFTIDATPEQAEVIGAIPGVKKVYPDLKVHEMLADSVQLINADKVWNLDVHGNDCRANGNDCLDGKGVTIGIIDTGVDYTHKDLGGSGSPTLEFLKIINSGISSSKLGDTLQVSDGIVYFLGTQDGQVYRYGPQDETAIKVTQNESLTHYSVFVYGKQLVSIVFSGAGYGILETNIETLEEKVLIPPTNLEMEISMQKNGQYLFFDVKTNYTTGQHQPENPESKPIFTAYVYDFLAGTLTLVISEAGITHRGLAMDGKVYYTGRQGNSIINVYDLSENRLLSETDYGDRIVMLDATGGEILVNNFDFDRYELFNPETGEKQILPQSANAAQGSAADENVISDEAFAFLVTGDSAQLAVFNGQLVVYEPQRLRDKFEVFDRANNKVVSFQNLPQSFVTIMLEGNTICFSTAASEVYCFDYDPSYDYTGGMMANPFPNDKVIGGYDFVNYDNDPMDDRGHGTHVAATAAGNGVLKGVAPGAQIVAYKSLDQNGDGSFNQIIAAIERSIDPNQDGNISDRLDIISLSLGANCREYNEFCGPDDPLSQSIDKAVEAGVTAVIAAGNEGPDYQTVGSPGTARKAITVGASDKSKKLAYFSSAGPVQSSNGSFGLLKPDVVAPGVEICAAQSGDYAPNSPCIDSEHVKVSGTSMATPHVSGAAALLKQKNPGWGPGDIKMALRNTASKLIEYEDEYEYWEESIHKQGYGMIDSFKAVMSSKPPFAELTTSGMLSGTVPILGTAKGVEPVSFEVSYSPFPIDSYPPKMSNLKWIKLGAGTGSRENGTIINSFNTFQMPDGEYLFRLQVTDSSRAKSEDMSQFILNTIDISHPMDSDIFRLGEIIDINGTIMVPGAYELEAWEKVEGEDGVTRRNIISSGSLSTPIIDQKLAQWDTSRFLKKMYELDLDVTYKSISNYERVGEILIEPSLRKGWPVHIPFDSEGSGDESAAPVGGSALAGEEVSNQQSGQPPLSESPIQKPTTAFISSPSFTGKKTPITNIEASTPGELKRKINEYSYNVSALEEFFWYGGDLVPLIADINGDGKKEIIVAVAGNPPFLLAFDADGNKLWNFALSIYSEDAYYLPSPIAVDLDGDGALEVVVYSMYFSPKDRFPQLIAVKGDGTIMWKARVPKEYKPYFLAADLNRDGSAEIVMKGNQDFIETEKMAIVNAQGKLLGSWELPHHRYLAYRMSMPAIGNFDDDPDFEIVSAGPANGTGVIYQNGKKIGYNNTGSIHLFNMDGSIVDGWPIYTQGLIFSSPVVGDIDGDGRHDIVVGLLYTTENDNDPNLGGLYAFDATGKALPGWPVLMGKKFWATPALTDIDYDGKLEIIASDEDFETFVISSKGVIQPGWPKITPWENFYSSLASDLDGDFIPDVGTTSGSIYTCLWDFCGGVHGWNAKGKPLPGFVKITEVDAVAPPVAADLDNDGTVELIASSNYDYKSWEETPKNRGSLYVWSLNTAFHPDNADWPMFMHDAQRTGCYDCIKPTIPDYCIDSDGINQFFSGIVKSQKSNVKSVFKDECSKPFDFVVEKSCKKDAAGGSTVASENIKCPTKGSCSKGRCANLLFDGNIQEKIAVNIDSLDDVSKPFKRWGLSNGAEVLKGSGAAGNIIKTVSGTKKVKYGSAAIQIVGAQPLNNYAVSAKARIISGYKPTLKLEFLNGQKKLLGQAIWNNDFGKKWSVRSVGAISPPGTSYARVSLFSPFIRGTTSAAEWDDVVLNIE